MSKIYDALIKAEKIPRTRAPSSRPSRSNKGSSLKLGWQDFNLELKVMGGIAGTMLLFGLLFLPIMNHLMGRALLAQIDRRAFLMATNLSDAAAGHVMGRNRLELHALVIKYARLDGSAYAFIQDSKGQVVAHSLGNFPEELRETLPSDGHKEVHRRTVRLKSGHEKTVYEVRVPILEGQVGAAHIGLWEESIAEEVYRAVLPIVGLTTTLFVAGVSLSVFLVRRIIRPIRCLTDIGGKISTASLESAVK
jgi:hypothetical protein